MMSEYSDGQVHDHLRWCEGCNRDHGYLYLCPNYPLDMRAQITHRSDQFQAALYDPKWCEEQMLRGVPPIALTIYRMFMGDHP